MIGHLCLYEVQNVALLCSNSYENVSTEIGHASFRGSFIKCSDDENNKHREKMHCLPVEKENHLVFTKSVDSNFRAF